MISTHTIATIARYEMRTLLRSWFFRIFAALAIFSLAMFNMAMFLEASGAPWIYRALPAALPYANLIILNLGQAVVAVFLASEFLKQDRKNDTIEVIYARSMTNGEYIFGKTLGVLAVFLLLNLIVLVVGIGFSFLSSDTSRGVAEYFVYPLLISLPTLIYMIGFSFFLMVTVKNQAVTFIILLGYIALSVFYLNNKFYNLPDFIAYHVPMMHSTISGFGQLSEMLIHRGIYLCLGTGFIFFTVFKLNRLPQDMRFRYLPLVLALFFFLGGGLLVYKILDLKNDHIAFRQTLLKANNLYADYPRVHTDSCKLEIGHRSDEIHVTAELALSNRNSVPVDTIILSLNPFLEVSSVKSGNQPLDYSRHLQILKIVPAKPLIPSERLSLKINYAGKISEGTHFLDMENKHENENFFVQIYAFRKHYAWLSRNFVCLTSESLWYPVSFKPYSKENNDFPLADFTKFELLVKTSPGLMAISQGKVHHPEKGVYIFSPQKPLPAISLLIGEYQKYSCLVDSVEYSLFARKGNEYFVPHFQEIIDSLPHLIRELKNEYEAQTGLKYPFERFSLAEVPAEFALDRHIWSISSDAVQPEMVFIPEKGIFLNETDFKRRKKREEERMKRDNEEVMPEELQARIFKKFIRNNLMAEPDQYFEEDILDRNTLSIFPQFFGFSGQLYSQQWALLNTALTAYLKERNISKSNAQIWWGENLDKGEQINLELNRASLSEIMKTGIPASENVEGQINLNELLLAKGSNFFALLSARFGDDKFNKMLDELILHTRYKRFNLEQLDSLIKLNFGASIIQEPKKWFEGRLLPGFLIKDIETYRIKDNEYTKFQLRLKISNPEPVDGMIALNIEMAREDEGRRGRRTEQATDFSKKIYLKAGTSREIGLVFPSEPARMRIYTNISRNLPNNLIYDFSTFDELKKVGIFDSIREIDFFEKLELPNEFVVDNEDEGFTYSQSTGESYLKSQVSKLKRNSGRYKYTRIYSWNPPGNWKFVLHSDFYGRYIRSGLYIKSGDGKKVASWDAKIYQAGTYDVYCHILRITNEWQRKKERLSYLFKVYHDEGFDEINLLDEELENGWIFLGTFYISPENAKVELSNKSSGNIVCADAIKWVKSK